MITTIIIILIYILSIFLARYLNKLTYKLDEFTPIWPMFWFFPIINVFSFIIVYFTTLHEEKKLIGLQVKIGKKLKN